MMRIKSLNFSILFIFLFLFFTLLNVEVIRGNRFKGLSDKNCIRLLPQEGSRGKIFDRAGDIIVDSSLSYDLMILPQEEAELDEALANVAKILGTNLKSLKDKFNREITVPFVPVAVAENIDIKKAFALEELKADFSSIIIQPRFRRNYPNQRLAAHVLGHLSEIDRWRLEKLADYGYKTKDIVGFGGIEEKYDYYLRQDQGGLSIEVDHRGRFARLLGFKPARSGKDIQLTLDIKIQEIIEEALKDKTGSVVIMNPYSGEIIALASSPSFDPSVFVRKDRDAVIDIINNPDSPFLNRAIGGSFPAGSVFKLVVAVAALETGKINLSTSFYCTGSIRIGGQEFSCWNTHHQQNLRQAITHSCNVFFYRTGLLVGPKLIHDYAVKFGLAKSTLIDLPYEVSGYVPTPLIERIYKFKRWFDGDIVNFSIGQGDLLVTPLQIARMMAVFANKGFLVRPYIVKAVEGQEISRYQKKITRMPVKISTIEYIRQDLENVVSDPSGTASVLSSLPFSVAGKTGTAQVSRGQPHAWFTGFFPFKNPKFVICVFLEHGGPGYAACVLTRQIIENMIREGLI